MEVVINALGMPFNGETVRTKSLGGSESAAYYLARELAAMNHRVTVFTTSEDEGTWDGVQYVHAGAISADAPLGERFTYYALNTPHDVLICQRHPQAFHKDYASKVNIWQLHDLALRRYLPVIQGGLPRIDFTTGVSDWHASQIAEVYELDKSALRVVRNGVDPALYEGDIETVYGDGLPPGALVMLYQSRPERGLEHLVRPGGIMDRLRNRNVHLYLCGYDNTTNAMAQYYTQLAAYAAALPNVTHLGALTKKQLADLQRQCDLMIYPTEFEEVSCITAMEAMAAHLPMVTSAHAALTETCADSGTELIPLKDGAADEDAFVEFVERVMFESTDPDRSGASALGRMAEAQRQAAARVGWQSAARQLMRHVDEHLENRRSNPARVLRHCIEHSDIGFLDWYRDEHLIHEPLDAIANKALEERAEMFKFVDEGLVEHYEHWEGVNCDKLGALTGSEDLDLTAIISSTRYRGLLSQLGELRQKMNRPLRVLEFGCAHGHIVCNLARSFPDCKFVGMDFMRRSIRFAVNYAKRHDISNVTFSTGSLDEVAALGMFDVVIMAEVLEHIYDYHGALEKLRAVVKASGSMLFTTPMGRWEWSGHDNFRFGREHLHHFEKEDWRDILREHPDHAMVYAPAAPDDTGQYRGSWIVRATLREDRPFGRVDYARKLKATAPRETVSLCLIAKDAEDTLRRCVNKVAFHVDEVVISVDKATTDKTNEVIARIASEHPHLRVVALQHEPALVVGFGPARNHTLEHASGDWILWMDADEELPQAHNLWRLLRPSAFNAYACPQIHYSTSPAQVLTTDYPARLFRNNRGVRFYGLVHEHPEDAAGKSISHAMMASDLQFLHNGYVDEPTRRARYHRNLPLLMRDIEENPDRLLNKFLLVRDFAQGLQFDAMNGTLSQARIADQANRGVAIVHEMIGRTDVPLRMVLDSMQYYSVLNDLLGAGFTAKLTWATQKPPFDTMGSSGSVEARFHDRATYFKLLTRIAEETTKHYESPHC